MLDRFGLAFQYQIKKGKKKEWAKTTASTRMGLHPTEGGRWEGLHSTEGGWGGRGELCILVSSDILGDPPPPPPPQPSSSSHQLQNHN